MPNRWGIPKSAEEYVGARDTQCVYCGIDNIALCRISCNASKGAKSLKIWLDSNYCLRKGITKESVSEVVKRLLQRELN